MQPFTIRDLIDESKCGLCPNREQKELVKHSESVHQLMHKTDLFSPITLAKDILKKLLNIRGHKKWKCGHCGEVFESKNDFKDHYDRIHDSLEYFEEKFYDNTSVHLLSGCCEMKLDPSELIDHLKQHHITSKCLLKQFYWRTKVVFGNGLVLNKHNLLGTDIDDSQEFDEFVKTINSNNK